MPAETHSHRGDLDAATVRALVIEQLAEAFGRDPDDLAPTARLRDDLDADDFGVLDAFTAIETELGERTVGFTLDDDELAEILTVADAIELVLGVCGLLGARGPDRDGGDA